ncbi:hypothetical protein EVAR_62350_1 [Eumeta japonica]|uniref:Chitin-binding type-2 domain-containing protein n=1 Tax=Eumeta variegata TaxID=151549 RepID=A0A4C1ZS91_EUMVA|nr:hypothetical protein EVAR_62350_1 [Eumeta japonica]
MSRVAGVDLRGAEASKLRSLQVHAILFLGTISRIVLQDRSEISNSNLIFTVVPQLCKGQRSRTEHEDGWDIRLSIPGEPGQDYPTLSGIPKTSFTCSDKAPGYYADVETDCQVFRVCAAGTNYGFQSFLCPNGTVFNQEVAVCDWWMNV